MLKNGSGGERPIAITCEVSDINGYQWGELPGVAIPDDISWRPDCIVEAKWRHWYSNEKPPNLGDREDSLPLISQSGSRPADVSSPKRDWVITHQYKVYYPVEVKSGTKLTLPEQQSRAIPRVSEEVDFVHPLIASVDIGDLPERYRLSTDVFTDSDWAESGSRYRS